MLYDFLNFSEYSVYFNEFFQDEMKNQSTQRIQRQYLRTLNSGLALISVKEKLLTSYSAIITDEVVSCNIFLEKRKLSL
jgi:hypothetical protein